MKIQSGLAIIGFVGSACLATPTYAASPATDAYVANVRPNVIFLDTTSRLALDKSSSRAVRAFAYGEAKQQTVAANSLTAWIETNTPRGEVAALGEPVAGDPLAPVGALVAAPVDLAAGTASTVVGGVGTVVTGRSVALDTPLTVTPAPTGAAPSTLGSQLLPSERDDMARLRALSGRQFDAFYKSTQLDGLSQLATLYRGYIANGDDPALRAQAAAELPKIDARLAALRRL